MSPEKRADYLRVRVWKDEPPSYSGVQFIAMRRSGNDSLRAALVRVTARGDLVGWSLVRRPTHWMPVIPIGEPK